MSINDASRNIIDDTRVMLPIVASHTDDSIIYDHYMFIIQATVVNVTKLIIFVTDEEAN
jgi:hypothetical protein